MAPVVVDTDVASFLFKRDSRALAYRRHLIGNVWILSFMSLAELDWWTLRHRWGTSRRQRLDSFLGQFSVVPTDQQLCRLWAEATQQARQRGRPIQCADAWIAATALQLNAPLVTNNPSDFASVGGLSLLASTSP